MDEFNCPKCNFSVRSRFFFCPNCGRKLKEMPVQMTTGKQLLTYLTSIFLPPLGLWPGIKYVRNEDQKVQMVGIFAIILTVLSSAAAIWYTYFLVQEIRESLNTQLNQLNELQSLPSTGEINIGQ